MNGAFYIGAISLDAQQRALDVIANNIANINTTAFKRSAVRFSDLVSPVRDGNDVAVLQKSGAAELAGVMLSGTPHVWAQGDRKQTGQPMDIAINGNGFIELLGPSGRSLLWRGGTLTVNSDGYLAATDGTPLRAMISVPQNSTLTIASDGIVSAKINGEASSQKLGQIDLVTAKSSDSLVDDGSGYYEVIDDAGITAVTPGDEGSGTLVQGTLEGSNVQLADEMTSLLLVQRAFGASAQVVQASDQLASMVNQLRR